MRKLIPVAALLVASLNAAAQWVQVGGAENVFAAYADPSTIRRTGHTVKMWNLLDYESPRLAGLTTYLSTKDHSEYDCQGERARTLYYVNFSGSMGTGDPNLVSDEPLNWAPIAPASVREALWRLACAAK